MRKYLIVSCLHLRPKQLNQLYKHLLLEVHYEWFDGSSTPSPKREITNSPDFRAVWEIGRITRNWWPQEQEFEGRANSVLAGKLKLKKKLVQLGKKLVERLEGDEADVRF